MITSQNSYATMAQDLLANIIATTAGSGGTEMHHIATKDAWKSRTAAQQRGAPIEWEKQKKAALSCAEKFRILQLLCVSKIH